LPLPTRTYARPSPTNKSGKSSLEQLKRVEENLSLGQEETADELAKLLVSAHQEFARRDTGKLEEWKLELVPDSNPIIQANLATASIITP